MKRENVTRRPGGRSHPRSDAPFPTRLLRAIKPGLGHFPEHTFARTLVRYEHPFGCQTFRRKPYEIGLEQA